jgi:hypothetical protein
MRRTPFHSQQRDLDSTDEAGVKDLEQNAGAVDDHAREGGSTSRP